jgi:hypothetical protein
MNPQNEPGTKDAFFLLDDLKTKRFKNSFEVKIQVPEYHL